MSIDKKALKVLIAYHKDCIDGFTSAWVTARCMERGGREVELLPMEYKETSATELKQALGKVSYDYLYIVDFSVSVQLLADFLEFYPYTMVKVIDHHKTAFEKYCPDVKVTPHATWQGELYGAKIVLDNNECGASMCHKILGGLKDWEPLIEYVKDYDLWRFTKGDETKWVNKYLSSCDKTLKDWDLIATILNYTPNEVLSEGMYLQKEHDDKCTDVASRNTLITICGHKGLAVQCPRALTSDVGHILAVASGTFGCLISMDTEKNEVTYSLRSNGDFDVSAIAKQFGGGGHKNAGGFMLPLISEPTYE